MAAVAFGRRAPQRALDEILKSEEEVVGGSVEKDEASGSDGASSKDHALLQGRRTAKLNANILTVRTLAAVWRDALRMSGFSPDAIIQAEIDEAESARARTSRVGGARRRRRQTCR